MNNPNYQRFKVHFAGRVWYQILDNSPPNSVGDSINAINQQTSTKEKDDV